MHYTIPPTTPLYPSHSPPQTAWPSTPQSVVAGQLCQSPGWSRTRGMTTTVRKATYEVHYTRSEPTPTSWWSSTSTQTASMSASLYPYQESHNYCHDVTDALPPALTRRQCIPLPSQSDSNDDSSVCLHPLLSCLEREGVHWDLAQPNGMVERILKERWHPLRELATYPELPSMTVIHPWLPWPITVHGAGMDSRGVTIADVLLTISRNLRIPVDETGRRTRMSYLKGKQLFVGLKASDIGGDVWELVVL